MADENLSVEENGDSSTDENEHKNPPMTRDNTNVFRQLLGTDGKAIMTKSLKKHNLKQREKEWKVLKKKYSEQTGEKRSRKYLRGRLKTMKKSTSTANDDCSVESIAPTIDPQTPAPHRQFSQTAAQRKRYSAVKQREELHEYNMKIKREQLRAAELDVQVKQKMISVWSKLECVVSQMMVSSRNVETSKKPNKF